MTKTQLPILARALGVFAASLLLASCSDSTGPQSSTANSILYPANIPPGGVVGSEVAPTPTFIVVDKHRRPVSGVVVYFSIIAGGGTVTPTIGVTGSDGSVSASWTLGPQPGINTLNAKSDNAASAQYVVTTVAAPFAALVPFKGDLQRAAAGSPLPAPLQVKAIDAYGNPIAGVPVTFGVVLGGHIDAATALSNESGVATSGVWTLGPSSGVQSVMATSKGVQAFFQADSFTCDAQQNGACVDWGQLVFVKDADGQLYRMGVDGSRFLRLTGGPGFEANATPRWSPDGTRVAFTKRVSNYDLGWDTDIYVMNADGSNLVQRTHDAVSSEPSWSPDGKRLIFTHLTASGPDLVVMNVDDASPGQLVVHNGHAAEWSPDGNRIAFLRSSPSYLADDIYTMNADSSGITRITNTQTGYQPPRWSPDGNKIASSTCNTPVCSAYVMNADGSGVSGFGVDDDFHQGQTSDPSWSSDGKWIALTFRDAMSSQLVYMPTTGGVPRVVLAGASAATWHP